MKLALAILIYLAIATVLSIGVFLLVAGKPWVFLAAVPVYLIAFSKIGCLGEH